MTSAPTGRIRRTTAVAVVLALPIAGANASEKLPADVFAPVVNRPKARDAEASALIRAALGKVEYAALFARMSKAQTPKLIEDLRPIARAEFHLIVVLCRPDDAQRRRLAADADRLVKAVARRTFALRMAYKPAYMVPLGAKSGASLGDPQIWLRDAIADAAKGYLTAAQLGPYREEIGRRSAGEQAAAVSNLLVTLDDIVILSPDQRDRIAAALLSNWQEGWGHTFERYLWEGYGPAVPDEFVRPFLRPSQRVLWENRRPRQELDGFGYLRGQTNAKVDEDESDDLRVAETLPPAVAARPD